MTVKAENSKAKIVKKSEVTKSSEDQITVTRVMDYLPAPEELARYEKVVPGGAERILEMAEKQSMHRREMEDKSVTAEIRGTKVKQALTFILALAAGVLGGVLLITGSELAGLMVILVDAAAVVGITVYGNREVEK